MQGPPAYQTYIQCELNHVALTVTPGSTVNTTAVAPTLWTDSFPPFAAIEPVLPDPQNPNEPVGFKEVFAADPQVLMQQIIYQHLSVVAQPPALYKMSVSNSCTLLPAPTISNLHATTHEVVDRRCCASWLMLIMPWLHLNCAVMWAAALHPTPAPKTHMLLSLTNEPLHHLVIIKLPSPMPKQHISSSVSAGCELSIPAAAASSPAEH